MSATLVAPALAPAPALTHAQLVPGHLVHRRWLSDVLVTEAYSTGRETFLAGAQWPRNHRLLGRTRQVDPALVAETVRQLAIYLAHTAFGVPLDAAFLMPSMRLSTAARTVQTGEAISIHARVVDVRRSARGVSAFTLEATFEDGDGAVGQAVAAARIIDRRTYQRTRNGRTPVTPRVDGPSRRGGLDLLAPTDRAGVSLLVVDTGEPAWFDHPLDHVPGMLLLSAAQQAVSAAGGPGDLSTMELVYDAVVELDEPCTVTVTDDGDTWRVSFEQSGAVSTSAVLRGRSEPSRRVTPSHVTAG
ncbi:ScbA/BarX family gamma-butyrolactone biosynthesis protein [Curtobacterium sp. MCBA15_012]|uniref:ScbA/BarX family gamma-butyrolactone biosynthesis protein n=1 Tax=Curtobacterium sp. MCBA15_012 TaxID=1898738 RepID=UPI0009F3F5B8|nr:ScbA/BarX family gamma-butyrolactone biosynthesis protein [Curtobacterium sp. MCBA15_012]WIB00391.1 ScbA/BarX family gamma-butyrolactone biosynthesis protein [Curtobacterium sp. MCBA15_012]